MSSGLFAFSTQYFWIGIREWSFESTTAFIFGTLLAGAVNNPFPHRPNQDFLKTHEVPLLEAPRSWNMCCPNYADLHTTRRVFQKTSENQHHPMHRGVPAVTLFLLWKRDAQVQCILITARQLHRYFSFICSYCHRCDGIKIGMAGFVGITWTFLSPNPKQNPSLPTCSSRHTFSWPHQLQIHGVISGSHVSNICSNILSQLPEPNLLDTDWWDSAQELVIHQNPCKDWGMQWTFQHWNQQSTQLPVDHVHCKQWDFIGMLSHFHIDCVLAVQSQAESINNKQAPHLGTPTGTGRHGRCPGPPQVNGHSVSHSP